MAAPAPQHAGAAGVTDRWRWDRPATPPPTLVVVGPTHFDLMLKLPRLPRPNDRLRVADVALEPGGMGGNVASAFARLGGQARFVGHVPDDGDGLLLCAALSRDGVDVALARPLPGSSWRGLILVGERGERAIIGVPREQVEAHLRMPGEPRNGHAAPQATRPDERAWRSAIGGGWSLTSGALKPPADAIYCPSIFGPLVLPALPDDLPLVIDVEARHTDDMPTDTVRGLLRRAALVFGNAGVLAGVAQRLGYADPRDLGREVGGVLVITEGSRGCTVVEGAVSRPVAGFRVQAIDTTGAGDCFAAAFTLGALSGMEPIQAATFANAAAALSVQGLGSRGATPGRAEVEALVARRQRAHARTAGTAPSKTHQRPDDTLV